MERTEKKSIQNYFRSMADIRLHIRRKSVLLKTVFSYIIIGSILIALLSSVLYSKFSNNSVQEIKKVTVDSLEHTANTFNELWNTTFHYMYKEFRTNGTLLDAMIRTDLTAIDYGRISSSLNEIITNYTLFDSVYVYNSDAGLMFSSIGPVRSRPDFYDQDIYEYLQNHDQTGELGSRLVVREANTVNGASVQNKKLITVIFSDDNLKSALIYNIDERLLRNMIVSKNSAGTSALLIIDQDGRVISRSDPGAILPDLHGAGFIQRILASPDASGYFNQSGSSQDQLISYYRLNASGLMNWSFVSVSNYSVLTRSVKDLQKYIMVMTGLFVLLSIAIAGWFTRHLYAPVSRLLAWSKGKVPPDEQGPAALNEYDYLSRVYESLNGDIELYKSEQHRNRSLLRNQFFMKALHGSYIHPDEWHHQSGMLGSSDDKFLTVVFMVDQSRDIAARQSLKALSLYRFSAANIAEEILSEVLPAAAVEVGEDQVVVIINMSRTAEKPVQLLEQIQAACQSYLKLSLSVSVGTTEKGLKGIHTSYVHALQAAEYCFVYGYGSVLDYTGTVAARQEEYQYPFGLEKQIIDALKSADDDKVTAGLESFISAISPFTCQEMMLALNQLAIMSARTVSNLFEPEELHELGIETDYWQTNKMMDRQDTLLERKAKLLQLYQQAMAGIRRKKDSRYGGMAAQIQAYIEEHFADPALNVDFLAGLVKLSPNYLRTLFKSQTGQTLSSYISEQRFSKAKSLLIETDHTVNQIAEIAGFQSSGYFYTAFKKETKLTPDEFRKQFGNNHADEGHGE
ncbi:helix-turn-helix domain-containing protein [Paenibacillus sp. GCM10027626]|uniref:helix-turn-helix domain-containing protein n=1 Tax=Paenibacillus sp. GCM10027626 TaxID=3273411 RepID=UPI00362C0498